MSEEKVNSADLSKTVTMQEWNYDLDAALGYGIVWLAGYNKCDKSRWIEEAVRTDEGWLRCGTFENYEKFKDNIVLVCWSKLVYPYMEERK